MPSKIAKKAPKSEEKILDGQRLGREQKLAKIINFERGIKIIIKQFKNNNKKIKQFKKDQSWRQGRFLAVYY